MGTTRDSKAQQIENLNQELARLQGEQQKQRSELLQERITRLDFQVQLLTQWRQRCQQELNQMLAQEGS